MGYFLSVFLGTFALEDLALASGIILVTEGKMTFSSAFLACFIGISVGDIGIYFMGQLLSKFGLEKKLKFLKKYRSTLSKMKRSEALTYSIVISRVIPGTRFITYLSAGFLGYPLFNFIILTVVSVAAWVAIAMVAGKSLTYFFMDHWVINLIIFLAFLGLVKNLVPRLVDRWQRKALIHSWRKWLHFEFWPALLFYLPIVPHYIYLSIRHRSLFAPFYASPHLKHGGLIGESKWDFLKHLNDSEPSTLKAIKLGADVDFMTAIELLSRENISYPFILKPDVGQRGYGVRIIRNDFDLTEYLTVSQSTRIIQRLSKYPREAGIFYVRKPFENEGYIFSITDKFFPFVVGDGKSQLGELILKDRRARIIAPVYFERLKEHLNEIPQQSEVIQISECGNHCQGAIFKNGEHLISPELTREIDRLAKNIPDFYFGRFDVRYLDENSLRQGKNFEIVEVNGAGSEATHIWDAKTNLFAAYKTLFAQWRILFEIGATIKAKAPNETRVHVFEFLKDSAKVFFRKESLSVSS